MFKDKILTQSGLSNPTIMLPNLTWADNSFIESLRVIFFNSDISSYYNTAIISVSLKY